MAGGESNILAAMNEMDYGPSGYVWFQKELPKRLFKQECGDWPQPSNIKAFIIGELVRKSAARRVSS